MMTVINVDWFRTIIDNIKNEINVQNNLSELKVALTALNENQLKQLVPSLQIDVIFDSLNSSNREQVCLCCEILNILLQSLPSPIVLTHFKASLNRALTHPEKKVKEVILSELLNCLSDSVLISELHNDTSLLKNVILCLSDEELSVANKAVEFLTGLGKIPEGLTIICHPSIKQNLIYANDLHNLRLYQVIIDISVTSYDALKSFEKEGFVEGLYQQLSSVDVLVRLALIEELKKLALTEHGFNFMQKRKIIELMVEQLRTCQEDPLSSIITPGLFKFFGSVGQQYPLELLTSYPVILKTIFKAVQVDDLPISVSAIEAISFIATSLIGKSLLKSQGEKYVLDMMKRISISIKSLSNEWKVRIINALANVIYVEDCSPASEMSELTGVWFTQVGPDLLPYLLQMARQPFLDLKLAALLVFAEMSHHSWGQQKIRDCPDLIDFLLDRSTETSLEAMEAKYNVVSIIVHSPSGSENFREIDFSRLKDFDREGPRYALTLPGVTFEGQL